MRGAVLWGTADRSCVLWEMRFPIGVTTMGMETLTQAAKAAGFAMAPPEDEAPAAAVAQDRFATLLARVPALLRGVELGRGGARESVALVGTWVRGYLPASGGRAPA